MSHARNSTELKSALAELEDGLDVSNSDGATSSKEQRRDGALALTGATPKTSMMLPMQSPPNRSSSACHNDDDEAGEEIATFKHESGDFMLVKRSILNDMNERWRIMRAEGWRLWLHDIPPDVNSVKLRDKKGGLWEVHRQVIDWALDRMDRESSPDWPAAPKTPMMLPMQPPRKKKMPQCPSVPPPPELAETPQLQTPEVTEFEETPQFLTHAELMPKKSIVLRPVPTPPPRAPPRPRPLQLTAQPPAHPPKNQAPLKRTRGRAADDEEEVTSKAKKDKQDCALTKLCHFHGAK